MSCNDETNWVWLDGTPLTYMNWDQNRPPRANEQCAVMTAEGTWHSQPCDTVQLKAICKRGMLKKNLVQVQKLAVYT